MRTIVAEDYDDLSRQAAAIVLDEVRATPGALLVLPTGATPRGLFRELIAAAREGRVDVSSLRFAVLDEYAGLRPGDRRSLTGWLRRELLEPLGVPEARLLAFDANGDPCREGARMEASIARAGGIDMAIVGLGPNGHVGLNEPGTSFDVRSGLMSLSPASIRSNAAYWGSEADVPRSGYTLGLGTLLGARKLMLLVSGAHKSGILARVLQEAPTPALPATIVRLHANGVVIADRAAIAGAGAL